VSAPNLFRQALSSAHLIAGIALLIIGGVFFTISSTFFLEERAYRNGRQADATVTRKHMRPATSNSSTAYEVTYTVRSSSGDEWEKTSVVEPSVWDGVERGSAIRVQYLPGDPVSLRVARPDRTVLVGFLTALTAPVVVLGLSLVGRGVRQVWRLARLYRHGQPADATITAVHETNVTINRRIQWAIDFTFRDHVGQVQHGTSAPMPPDEALEWREGDTGIIRFDPQRPGDSVWVGQEAERSPR